ncbi:MAG: alpha/beta hydrolase [Anaerolineales bacterium]
MKLEILQETPHGTPRPTPLLFIHGKWHGAWCWAEHFLPYFAAQGYACTALSLRGHAGSEGHERLRWTSIAEYVADVEQVAAQLSAPPVVIGHSMGGFITQKYLERHPETPAAVLLASIPPGGLWPTTFLLLRRRPMVVLKALATLRMYPVIETPDLARWALFSKDMPEEWVEKYHRQMGDESFRSYLDELGLNLVHPRQVQTPMLVIGAQRDQVIPPRMVRNTARAYGVEPEIFPHIAHDVMLENGWEQVAARIAEWLQEKGI